jgi:hypothetical protein
VDLRFLQVVDSSAPDFPFMPGQTITGLARLSPQMEAWVRGGLAEVVREDDQVELATVGVRERAVVRKGRRG